MQTQYEIRRADLADLERIVQIENASFGAEAYERKLFAEYRNRCGELFLVAERRQRVWGYLIACRRGEAGAELVSVAVDPAARRSGAASALLESLFRRLRRRGVVRLNLMVRGTNRPAQAFYEKYGFRRRRKVPGYYEDGGDGIAMSREVQTKATP
jgi:[ribosomal protein S18]-alanine N-acetyltransferase